MFLGRFLNYSKRITSKHGNADHHPLLFCCFLHKNLKCSFCDVLFWPLSLYKKTKPGQNLYD